MVKGDAGASPGMSAAARLCARGRAVAVHSADIQISEPLVGLVADGDGFRCA